jgi:hypothetical protein
MPDLTVNSQSYTPDEIIAGEHPRVTKTIVLVTGQNQPKGAVLGRTATAGTINGAAAAGNTGNGTIGTLSVGGGAKEGVYKAICIEPATNAGVFAVYDPDGLLVGRANVGVGFTGPVNFTIADGGVDFVAGDTFNITVSAVTYKWKLAVAAATDGSDVPRAILAEACDATAADKEAPIYQTGIFDPAGLAFGAGHDATTVRAPLEAVGIYLRSTVAA